LGTIIAKTNKQKKKKKKKKKKRGLEWDTTVYPNHNSHYLYQPSQERKKKRFIKGGSGSKDVAGYSSLEKRTNTNISSQQQQQTQVMQTRDPIYSIPFSLQS
jgi:hypothetical protein